METQQDKVSYIIGRQMGGDFKNQGIELNIDVFAGAVRDAFTGAESKLSNTEMEEVMTAFQTEMQAKAMEKAAVAGAENRKAGEAYLAKNKEDEGVTVTETGLQYKVIKSGSGKTPTETCTVETHYEGKLIDGTIFDSSYKRGEPASFPVNRVIPGWTEALQLMKEGDVWELTIPSELAYGPQGAGGDIGPDSTLIFKIELNKVL